MKRVVSDELSMLAVLNRPNRILVAVEEIEIFLGGRFETIVSSTCLCSVSEVIEDNEEDGFRLVLDMPGMCFLA
uniref:BTB/POZ domain-containing protein At5g66560-like n=1 Tax=Rhizophora mucronata TaxID=61149 RepID=A0A2P2Q7E9_RHIMU